MILTGVGCPFSELLQLFHQDNNLYSLGNVADENHVLVLAELSFVLFMVYKYTQLQSGLCNLGRRNHSIVAHVLGVLSTGFLGNSK